MVIIIVIENVVRPSEKKINEFDLENDSANRGRPVHVERVTNRRRVGALRLAQHLGESDNRHVVLCACKLRFCVL